MTQKKQNPNNVASLPDREQVGDSVPEPQRRTLVKGAVAAMPFIVTLQSGAALAQSSGNTVTQATPNDMPFTDENGDPICYIPVSGDAGNNRFDLGEPPYMVGTFQGPEEGCEDATAIIITASSGASII